MQIVHVQLSIWQFKSNISLNENIKRNAKI